MTTDGTWSVYNQPTNHREKRTGLQVWWPDIAQRRDVCISILFSSFTRWCEQLQLNWQRCGKPSTCEIQPKGSHKTESRSNARLRETMEFPDYTSNSFHLLVSVSNFPTVSPRVASIFLPSPHCVKSNAQPDDAFTTFCEANQTHHPRLKHPSQVLPFNNHGDGNSESPYKIKKRNSYYKKNTLLFEMQNKTRMHTKIDNCSKSI